MICQKFFTSNKVFKSKKKSSKTGTNDNLKAMWQQLEKQQAEFEANNNRGQGRGGRTAPRETTAPRLCKYFTAQGDNCRHGADCKFAHQYTEPDTRVC